MMQIEFRDRSSWFWILLAAIGGGLPYMSDLVCLVEEPRTRCEKDPEAVSELTKNCG